MHIQIISYILKSTLKTWILITTTGIMFYVLNFIWPVPELTQLGHGNSIPDLMPFGANMEYIQNLLVQLGDTGRSQYLIFLTTLDVIFPILYSLFFGILIWMSISHISISEEKKWILTSIPFIAAIFDYIENLTMISSLLTFPNISITLVHIGSIATIFKNIFSSIGLSLLVGVGFYHLIQKIYKYKK